MSTPRELKSLKEGDFVILNYAQRHPSTADEAVTVKKVTAKRLYVGGGAYDRATGRSCKGYNHTSIRAGTVEDISLLQSRQQRAADERQRAADERKAMMATPEWQYACHLPHVEAEKWQKLSVDQLKQIFGWLKMPKPKQE